MHNRSAAFWAPLAAAAVAALVVSGGLASAAGQPAGGVVHVYEASAPLSSPVASDIFTGAITDYGKDHIGVAGRGTINKFVLSKGSFEIDVANLVRRQPAVDLKTCSFGGSETAATTIVKGTGTGAYAHITGTVRVTLTDAGILPRLKSGKCNLSQTVMLVAGVGWATGSGTVSFK